MQEKLTEFRLTLHPVKQRIFPVSEGCDFVGYRIWRTHRLLRRHSGYRFRRRLKGLAVAFSRWEIDLEEVAGQVAAWIGHARHADTWGLRRAIFRAVKFTGTPAGG